MKTSLLFFAFLGTAVLAHALNTTTGGYNTLPFTATASAMSLDFSIDWSCDDYPQSSAPGRIDVVDGSGTLVARLTASVYRSSGPSFSGAGTVTNVAYYMFRYAADG